jgi:hypothetical protein
VPQECLTGFRLSLHERRIDAIKCHAPPRSLPRPLSATGYAGHRRATGPNHRHRRSRVRGSATIRSTIVVIIGNRFYFAGEGSHETHPSTVPGALHEGERAAGEVDSANGNPNDPPPVPVPEPNMLLGLATGGTVLWLLAGNRRRQRAANS